MEKRTSYIHLELKRIVKDSWTAFKKHYFMNVLIVFMVSIIVGGYSFSTKNAVIGTSSTVENAELQAVYDRATGKSNAEVIEDLINELEFLHIDTRLAKSTAQKYSRGVVSVFVNEITSSGSVGFGVLNGINSLLFKDKISRSIVIFCFAALLLVFNILVRNILVVGKCRYFMEHRRYLDTKPDKLLFVYKFGKTNNVAKVMFLRYIFQLLWNFTIIGGFVKRYEYAMIPYILAENPDIEWKEAFKLSKKLAFGEKRRIFALDLICFVGYILSSFTYNFLNVFVVNPVKECAYAEIYMTLRELKTDHEIKSKLLFDETLTIPELVKNAYPEDAYKISTRIKRTWIKIDYERDYSFTTIILFFFSFAFVGWVWEVFYTLLNEGVLANRGTLTGPWLPIYGFGGLIIIVLLKPFRKNPLVMFGVTVVACGILEYLTSWVLELLFDAKWWDYTGYFLNINGRICLEGLFVFGLAGVGFTYIFAPMLDNLYSRLTMKSRKPICIVLVALFLVDAGWSAFHPNKGAGVTIGDSEVAAEIEAIKETAN